MHQRHDIPESIRALSTIADPDYIDLFTLVTDDASADSPERWARVAFGEVAGLTGQFVFRVLLGLRLKWRPAPTHVAGWKIAERGPGWLRLEARSWMLTSHLVVHIEDDRVSLATFKRFDKPFGARVWTRISAYHRREAPGLLRDAHRILRARTS